MYNKETSEWINSLININAGFLFKGIEYENRPVSLKPILKVQDNKQHYEWQHNHGVGCEIIQNIHELTFYINGSNYGNKEYYRQTHFPLKECQTLDSSKILSFISNSITPFLSNINLVGNVFLCPDFEKIVRTVSEFSIKCTIYIFDTGLY
jgi:hypothetical protein